MSSCKNRRIEQQILFLASCFISLLSTKYTVHLDLWNIVSADICLRIDNVLTSWMKLVGLSRSHVWAVDFSRRTCGKVIQKSFRWFRPKRDVVGHEPLFVAGFVGIGPIHAGILEVVIFRVLRRYISVSVYSIAGKRVCWSRLAGSSCYDCNCGHRNQFGFPFYFLTSFNHGWLLLEISLDFLFICDLLEETQ